MARTKHIWSNTGREAPEDNSVCQHVTNQTPTICSALKISTFCPENTKDPVFFLHQQERSVNASLRFEWVLMWGQIVATLMLNICPNYDCAAEYWGIYIYFWVNAEIRDGRTIRRKNKLSSFLRQILRFLPLGNIRRFIRLGGKGVPKPFPHLRRGDIEPHQISRDGKWAAPGFSFSTNNYKSGGKVTGTVSKYFKLFD